jgi:NADH-quinone oxidoreductase subunit N
MLWLAVIGVTMSFVSLYYYLMVIKELYIGATEDQSRLPVPPVLAGLTVVMVLGIFYVGLYPRHIFEAAQEATKVLFV